MKNATRKNDNRFILDIAKINHIFVIVTTSKKDIANNFDLVFFQQRLYQDVHTDHERRHKPSGKVIIILIKHEKEVSGEEWTYKDTSFLTSIKPNILSKEHNHNDSKGKYS